MSESPLQFCLSPGCVDQSMRLGPHICNTHWFKLPMRWREAWWKHTELSRGQLTRQPSGMAIKIMRIKLESLK